MQPRLLGCLLCTRGPWRFDSLSEEMGGVALKQHASNIAIAMSDKIEPPGHVVPIAGRRIRSDRSISTESEGEGEGRRSHVIATPCRFLRSDVNRLALGGRGTVVAP
jgi:hypothetical protein